MSYNPDPIFRDGFNGYRKPAPLSAWERIESGLERKRQKNMWLKIAAGLIILIATSIVFWQYNQTVTTVASNLQESSSTILKTDTVYSEGQEESKSTPHKSLVDTRQSKIESSPSEAIVEQYRNNHSDVVPKHLPVVERTGNELVENLRSTNTLGQNSNVSLNTSEEKKTAPIVEANLEKNNALSGNETVVEVKRTSITYTADQVNAKFTKPNVVPEATPEKKNASGLKKALDMAIEITNEGTVFGEIREKKNEWLSFNNLSNKTEPNK